MAKLEQPGTNSEAPGTSTESTSAENKENKPTGPKKKSLEENWNLQESDSSTDEEEKEMLLRSGQRVHFK